MYKTHSILIALVMLSASCFRYAVGVHAPTEAQDHHQHHGHGGHPHRRAQPANVVMNSSSSEGSPSAASLPEPLIIDLGSKILKDLASKYNITTKTNNGSEEQASHRSSAGRKRAAHPGCCG